MSSTKRSTNEVASHEYEKSEAIIERSLKRQRGWRGLSPEDQDDVAQIVRMTCFITWGPGYAEVINRITASGDDDIKKTLFKIISRSVGEMRWTPDKRRQRGLPMESASSHELRDVYCPNETNPMKESLIDFRIDLSQGLNGLGKVELAIWDGLVAWKTTREIGKELCMDHRVVAKKRAELKRVFTTYMSEIGRRLVPRGYPAFREGGR